MASSVFSSTLQALTTAKLTELAKKRTLYENQKSAVISKASKEADSRQRLAPFIEGVKKCFAVRTAARKRGDRRGGPGRIVSGSTKDPSLEVLLRNIERFLDQSRYDPSIAPSLVLDWEKSLIKKLDVQSLKYQYATLYGELVTEWLGAEKSAASENESETLEGFEKINRAEKDEARANWEKTVFEAHETDPMAISEYLLALFGEHNPNKQMFKGLQALWRSVKTFETSMSTPDQFNDSVLRWTINGLLVSGLLSDEKRAVLKDFLASPVILTEVADVLNMRISSISTWVWEDEIPVEQRRHVTGKYHIYIDEELLQAIFLQYIGIKWSIFFKEAFTNFSNYEGAWTSLRPHIPKQELDRRDFFLGPQNKKHSVQSKRQGLWKSYFFMSQLPDSPYEESSAVDGEEEVDYDNRPHKRSKQTAGVPMMQQQMMQQQKQHVMQQQQQHLQGQAQMMYQQAHISPQASAGMSYQIPQQMGQQMRAPMALPLHPMTFGQPSDPPHSSILKHHQDEEYLLEPPNSKPKSPIETKQFLLHLLSTELLLNTRIHGEFTVSRSEFQSWFPTLPHSTILSVLSFFGLSKKWQGFFRKFLAAPLKFPGDPEPRARKRGVPGAHALSAVCGEVVLFCLDYSVNQMTEGAQLYRMHDDFWLWSKDHETVMKGWEAITSFSDVMGVTLNRGKTGTVRIVRDYTESQSLDPSLITKTSLTEPIARQPAPISPSLPQGEIRWGFLSMDPVTGRFLIDQEMVDTHILSLQTQLANKSSSIFGWIQAWNTYAGTFFKTNFGKPANCYGREHVDMLLETMTRIQTRIFGESDVVRYLKEEIGKRFGVMGIPDGYLYFPTHLGGLELQNPFITLLQVRNSVWDSPSSALDDFLESEQEAYRKAKTTWEAGKVHRSNPKSPVPANLSQFFSFEEYSKHREEFHAGYEGDLLSVFVDLLTQPVKEDVDAEIEGGGHGGVGGGGGSELCWRNLKDAGMEEGEKRWIAMLHGREIVEMFGGLEIVDKGLLPMGMVGLFRSGRVKWQG